MKINFTLDCNDLETLAHFWSRVLGYRSEPIVPGRYTALSTEDPEAFQLTLQRVEEPKTCKNRMHLDLLVDDLEAEVERIESLGGKRLMPAPTHAYGERWFVMADPEGNEFCVSQTDV